MKKGTRKIQMTIRRKRLLLMAWRNFENIGARFLEKTFALIGYTICKNQHLKGYAEILDFAFSEKCQTNVACCVTTISIPP